jgi:hypothetical protein
MTEETIDRISRRAFVTAAVVAIALPTVACSQAEPDTKAQDTSSTNAATPVAMTVYRDPSCPCCEDWVEIANRSGFQVQMIDDPDMPGRKKQLGVPETLASCHTAQVAGLVFEGHVPIEHIKQLMASNERDLLGLAVPGMPRGSPGMEMPDGSKDPFDVIAFDRNGNTSVFAKA